MLHCWLWSSPEAFSQNETLSALDRDRENIAFGLCSKVVYNLPPRDHGSLRLDRMFLVAPASEAIPLFIAGVSINDRLAFFLNSVERVEGWNALTGDMIRIRNKALEYLGFPWKASDRAI